jgi:hypothetical protein
VTGVQSEPQQGHLFDPARAEAAKAAAIDQVDSNAPDNWKYYALRAVYAVCRRRLKDGTMEFTTDAVTAVLQHWGIPEPHEPRALGAVMQTAARRKWCVPTDRMQKSIDVTCHQRKKQVWRVEPDIPEWDGD